MKVFKNLRIGAKLILLLAISTVALLVVGFTGYSHMKEMANKSEEMYEERLLPVMWLGQLNTNNSDLDSYILELIISKDADQDTEFQESITNKIKENETLIAQYKQLSLLPAEEKNIETLEMSYAFLGEIRQKVIDLATNGNKDIAYKLYVTEAKSVRKDAEAVLSELKTTNERAAEELAQENQVKIKNATVFLVIIILGSIIFCILTGAILAHMITKPIKELQYLMKKAEEGDFTVKGTHLYQDEVGQLTTSFNQMVYGLREIIQRVHTTSEQVAASSEVLAASAKESGFTINDVSKTIQELSSGAEEQARNTDQTFKIMNEMTAGVSQISIQTKSVVSKAVHTNHQSSEGRKSIDSSITQMNNISTNVNELSTVVKGLGSRSNEIFSIVKVISEIAEQTNLLALNAAIEAARAGDHGKGFAVVASEVRKLAEQSAKSSKQITDLLTVIQDETHQAVASMEETSEEVNEGIKVVGAAGETFTSIQHAIQDVTKQVEEVSIAIEQMAVGTDQVKEAIQVVSQIADQSAAGSQSVSAAAQQMAGTSEEITSSSMKLATIADNLQDLVKKFKI
ncbi:methyl-accepting chemotaxis protein [Bacillus mesophilus]|uniref:Methyl-accepting chemotaxis protein n=1 Tax=Bacillus mesophilus TaxID=1808955 RepID=A0A6M0QCZ1_9BACI|nr:methyl-accepting chemotaxis protein [Bacillus mesophilus]MBM7662820.1 methyl-accepting chemotaxis protein [Bacillus mesophilus]NEY73410.1 methyl-accepting chemotaxis protein [Bacillus mesophilus]